VVDPQVGKAIINGGGEDTERSRILDIARGAPWPQRYPARTIRNAFLERWRGREDELEADDEAKTEFQVAAAGADLSVVPVWASEAIDLITSLSPAADLVAQLSTQAEAALIRAGQAVTNIGARP
jgi:nitronate monooxygenase